MVNIWALIQNSIVVNIVVANIADSKDPKYQWIDVTNIKPQPVVGASYNGKDFLNPEVFIDPGPFPASYIIQTLDSVSRDALVKIPGSLIFNIDTKTLQYFDGSSWIG